MLARKRIGAFFALMSAVDRRGECGEEQVSEKKGKGRWRETEVKDKSKGVT